LTTARKYTARKYTARKYTSRKYTARKYTARKYTSRKYTSRKIGLSYEIGLSVPPSVPGFSIIFFHFLRNLEEFVFKEIAHPQKKWPEL